MLRGTSDGGMLTDQDQYEFATVSKRLARNQHAVVDGLHRMCWRCQWRGGDEMESMCERACDHLNRKAKSEVAQSLSSNGLWNRSRRSA